MKRIIILAACFATFVAFTGCIDIVRGAKNITYIKADMESQVRLNPTSEVTVAADKNYSDAFKADATAPEEKK